MTKKNFLFVLFFILVSLILSACTTNTGTDEGTVKGIKTSPTSLPNVNNFSPKPIVSPKSLPRVLNGASAICRDGTYSYSQHRQGTCSHHGGVAQWL